MTNTADEISRLVTRALPLQVTPPQAGQQHPVWHVPDDDPTRVQAAEALALAAQQRPDAIRQAIAAYQQQHAHDYPQQPLQLTWEEGPPDPAALALAELVLEAQPRS
ncbi:hypothetical protein E5F05_03430 (plasmid) [Deinococcus metallilatus]|uniref:Uncharacterized protein n=1 Tax=Deinococcus metallilatus TaxID=1211322 RepID=A0AAJ5JZR0_9DEIO|nr:hypothetical protein [Deinococcus metallilatus]MBB5297271.1 hypothetical protein [Deinococcus metallilatus]QBY06982.1 hypothetical protein E5F05_03430 [Deinococcus metallilatus]TLK31929.1 hypothetical protein FCS05_00195 [Deinococcus metallilatus]GMA17165.1 hypothetical protein GCM10025871_34960 [Deinococcus metallilatus]